MACNDVSDTSVPKGRCLGGDLYRDAWVRTGATSALERVRRGGSAIGERRGRGRHR